MRTRRANHVERAIDRVVTSRFGLPPATTRYSVVEGLRTPMRDGVELVSNLLRPDDVRGPIVLMRTPYARSGMAAQLLQGALASRGFPVLVQSCRGMFGSGGEFLPAVNEREDAADTLAWLRQQGWYDGRLVVAGGSYVGYTGWQVLAEDSPDVVGAVLLVAVHDFYRAMHWSGALNVGDLLTWADVVRHQEELRGVRALLFAATSRRRLRSTFDAIPVLPAAESLLGPKISWFRDWALRTEADDPYWAARSAGDVLNRVEVPLFLASGWQDVFLDQSLQQFQVIAARGRDVSLTVGPWTHANLLTVGGPTILPALFDWLESRFVDGTAGPVACAPSAVLRYYVTGADTWIASASVPRAPETLVLYPHASGALSNAPASVGQRVELVFDPDDPTPTVGGRLLSPGAGRRRDDSLAARGDVLCFETDAFETALEIIGAPAIDLNLGLPDGFGDVLVRLDEVTRRGRSMLITEGYRRMDGVGSGADERVHLDFIAHRVSTGSRLRLLIAGGSHPRFARNLGAHADNLTTARTARSRIELDLRRTSLTLPVHPMAPQHRPSDHAASR